MGSGATPLHQETIRATERVYLGGYMLRAEFPDVLKVSERVLRAFHCLKVSTVREIKHFVRRFHDIQYGEVTARSLPDSWPGYNRDEIELIKKRWEEKYSHKPEIVIVTAAETTPGPKGF